MFIFLSNIPHPVWKGAIDRIGFSLHSNDGYIVYCGANIPFYLVRTIGLYNACFSTKIK